MQTPPNLKTAEAARYLRKSTRTLIRWRNARIGPKFVRAGGSILYRRCDLDAFLEANTVTPMAAEA